MNNSISVKRSPPSTPVPNDPTNERLKKPNDFGSTFTVTKAASPNISRKISSGVTNAPPPESSAPVSATNTDIPSARKLAVSGTSVKMATKAKATVPPLSNQTIPPPRANKDGLSKKVVHEVTPLVRVKSDDQSFADKNATVQQQAPEGRFGRTFTLSPDDFLPVCCFLSCLLFLGLNLPTIFHV